MTDWRSMLQDRATHGRRLLKQLIVGRLEMQPNLEERCYEFRGTGTLLPVVAGVVPQSMASLAPASWNQIAGWLRQIDGLRQAA